MIVKMKKVMIATRLTDRDKLLDSLADIGIVHLSPVEPNLAVPCEESINKLDRLNRARNLLSSLTTEESLSGLSAQEAADETLNIANENIDLSSRLNNFKHQIARLDIWGDATLEQFKSIREAGLNFGFYYINQAELSQIKAECVEVIVAGKRTLVAVASRDDVVVPDSAEQLHLPDVDRPDLCRQIEEVDTKIRQNQQRLRQLASLTDSIQKEIGTTQQQQSFTVARNGGLQQSELFAVQGWCPAEISETLTGTLKDKAVESVVQILAPEEDEEPPTLIKYPGWTKPIKGLFDILGTVAGYREFDVSVPFMLALPFFAAILIGDGGYGAILFFGLLLGYKKIAPALGKEFTNLLITIGATTLIWGCICASFFGVELYKPLIPVDMSDASRNLMMKISFYVGAIHLSIAQLWVALRLAPNLKFLSKIGWAIFVWGMLGVVQMFVLGHQVNMNTIWPYLLMVGAALAIIFESPNKNIIKMLALGTVSFPLAMLSAFSDVISYVRLMAVGLASSVLAKSFNELATGIDFVPATILILIFGHSLNIGLALIALFAHGVRLNMLEFSNNLGMQWGGHPYAPFTIKKNAIKKIRTIKY